MYPAACKGPASIVYISQVSVKTVGNAYLWWGKQRKWRCHVGGERANHPIPRTCRWLSLPCGSTTRCRSKSEAGSFPNGILAECLWVQSNISSIAYISISSLEVVGNLKQEVTLNPYAFSCSVHTISRQFYMHLSGFHPWPTWEIDRWGHRCFSLDLLQCRNTTVSKTHLWKIWSHTLFLAGLFPHQKHCRLWKIKVQLLLLEMEKITCSLLNCQSDISLSRFDVNPLTLSGSPLENSSNPLWDTTHCRKC